MSIEQLALDTLQKLKKTQNINDICQVVFKVSAEKHELLNSSECHKQMARLDALDMESYLIEQYEKMTANLGKIKGRKFALAYQRIRAFNHLFGGYEDTHEEVKYAYGVLVLEANHENDELSKIQEAEKAKKAPVKKVKTSAQKAKKINQQVEMLLA